MRLAANRVRHRLSFGVRGVNLPLIYSESINVRTSIFSPTSLSLATSIRLHPLAILDAPVNISKDTGTNLAQASRIDTGVGDIVYTLLGTPRARFR